MPELPEVETVRRGLADTVIGARVDHAVVTGARSVRRQPATELEALLAGATVTGARRSGKHLLVDLVGTDSGPLVLVTHLRMSGQLLLVARGAPVAPHTHVTIAFTDGRDLRFVDPRTFGEMAVADPDEITRLWPSLGLVGPEPLDPSLTARDLRARMAGRRVPLKAWLMDSRNVAGIGNIYSDEICHRARLAPEQPVGDLRPAAVERVRAAMVSVLGAAVERRGSSLGDAQYVDLFGAPGGYQADHLVYGREGEACQRCGGPITRVRFGQRSSFRCARCQRAVAGGQARSARRASK